MPRADTKKVQTMVNIVGKNAEKVRNAVALMKAVRSMFQAVNPSTANTPLAGNEAAVSAAINALDAEISKPVWSGMIDAVSPTHTEEPIT